MNQAWKLWTLKKDCKTRSLTVLVANDVEHLKYLPQIIFVFQFLYFWLHISVESKNYTSELFLHYIMHIIITILYPRLNNEGVLVSLSNRLHLEALAALPSDVRRRLRALRTLQREFVDVEAAFYAEVHALECKYERLYKPIFEKVTMMVMMLLRF